MLTADQPPVRWAAVRAMSQIGGDDAHPAVEFMIKQLQSGPSEVDGYNMMVYLAILGPAAKDALPAIRSSRIKNPVLPSAATWAVQSDKYFPWQSGGGRFGGGPGGGGGGGPGFGGGGGGPGGGGPGGGGGGDIARFIYEALVPAMGERLRPAAKVLAQQLLDGKAGDIPTWGYKILAYGTDDAVAILALRLADADIVIRERAAVALGYMGPAAAAARSRVAAAVDKSPTEREKRLMKWCSKQIAG